MRPFFVKEAGSPTVWYCREAGRSPMASMDAVNALALLSQATNGLGDVYNSDGASDAQATEILSHFAILP